jgi:BASS family bile acid:Na+ symporter
MGLLAGSSALAAPLLLSVGAPLVAGPEPVRIPAVPLVGTLLATQLAPLCVGLGVGYWRPSLAARWRNPANQVSKALCLLAIGLILATQYHTLLELRLRSVAVMMALLAATLAAGWLAGGGSDGSMRKTLALTTSLRNVGLGLVLATGAFADTPAAATVIAYGLIEILGSLAAAVAWGRREGTTSLREADGGRPTEGGRRPNSDWGRPRRADARRRGFQACGGVSS